MAAAGKKLGVLKSWENFGRSPEAVWGECRGNAVYQGGNDTPRALSYCQSIITRPAETVMVLVTDCYEGPSPGPCWRRQPG